MQPQAKVLFATLMLLGLTACRSEVPPVQRSSVIDEVELSDILANPEQFDRVKLRVKGIARIEFEGNSLYFDRDAFTVRRWKKAIWLDLGWPVKDDIQKLNGRDVVVEGTFDASLTGHEAAYVGSMVAISKLSPARQ
jgi:hypothetical protein